MNLKQTKLKNVGLSRRRFLIGASGALGVAALSACVAPPSASMPAQPTSAPVQEASSAFPVSITHKFGATEIKAEPKRVIALGFSDQDPILALGVKPIATRFWWGDEGMAAFPWAMDELGDAKPEVLNMVELNFEKIAALKPDLIVATYAGINEKDYATLSKIAPTVAQSSAYADYGMPWQETTLMIGQALGRESQAKALIADIEARFADIRTRHPEYAGKSVIIGSPDGKGQFGFMASQDPRSRVFAALGFKVPEAFDKIANGQFYGMVSTERLDLLNVDLLVFHQLQWVKGGREAIETDPLLSKIPTMKEGRAIFLEGKFDDAFQFSSVLSLPLVLDQLVPLLEAALGGETTTAVTTVAPENSIAFPVTIKHTKGEAVLSAPAKRVVALEWTYVENLLALGVQPLAIADIEGYNTWVKTPFALANDVADIGLRGEPNLESIAKLKPDLIIMTAYNADLNYEKLNQIAPTLVFEPYPTDPSLSQYDEMRETFMLMAKATDKQATGEAALKQMEAKFADAKTKLEAAGRGGEKFILSQAYFYEGKTTVRLFTQNGMATQIMMQLGLTPAWDDGFQPYGFTEVSFEKLAELKDVSFFYIVNDTENPLVRSEIKPVWESLSFVKAGRAYPLGGDTWLFGGPLSAEMIVDRVLAQMKVS